MRASQALKLAKAYKPPKYSEVLKKYLKAIRAEAIKGNKDLFVGDINHGLQNAYLQPTDINKLKSLGYRITTSKIFKDSDISHNQAYCTVISWEEP